MSDERRGYRYDRVLIESDRILSPQFADAVVFLSGAQIEMLRNVTQYLRRLDTYVSSYHQDYYLTPDASDYDDILAMVSDLEEVLMGNPNTILGYTEHLYERAYTSDSPGGDYEGEIGPVPVGELWRIESIRAEDQTSVPTDIECMVRVDWNWSQIAIIETPPIGKRLEWDGMITLPEGSKVEFRWHGSTEHDYIIGYIRGYVMTVDAL